MKVVTIKPNADAVILTESNLPTGIVFKNKTFLTNINFWHKFTVNNAEGVSRNDLLGAILDHVHPLDLIPVSYWVDNTGTHFLARNCASAIQKLCNDNLTVNNPKSTRPFKLTIVLKFSTTGEFKVDVQKNLLQILVKRYDVSTKTLNLMKFHSDPGLKQFCPLSQPKIMFFVLHLSKSLQPNPEKIILSDNGIKLLNPLEALVTHYVKSIKSLDLRNNSISDWNTVQQLKSFKLTELYLDGNPLCESMSKEEYVFSLTKINKELTLLDGVAIKEGSFPTPQKNFLCNFEALDLVNQFLEVFFHNYDSRNRVVLKDLYHKNALLSLNSSYNNAQLSSSFTRLHHYNTISRNIHKLANFSQIHNNLYQGNTQITNILCRLPLTEHDPYSFTVDVMMYTDTCVVVSVSGVFRELPETLLEAERVYGFLRTFVIERVNETGLCKIVNEQIHIYNSLSWQMVESFKVNKPIDTSHEYKFPQTPKEKQTIIKLIRMISTLNTEWATKCLQECNFDLKKAILLFLDLFKQNRIPPDGFLESSSNKKKKYL